MLLLCPRPRGGAFWNSVIVSVPWRSCLGYRHAGCLQLSQCRPPEMCGLWTRPRTDVDPPRFLPPRTAIGGGHIVSPPPGRYLAWDYLYKSVQFMYCKRGFKMGQSTRKATYGAGTLNSHIYTGWVKKVSCCTVIGISKVRK